MTLGLVMAGALGSSAASSEQNWPQWRGPLAIGIAPNANPPTTWSETEHIRWKVKIPGRGSATPIIWDNRIFVETAIPTGRQEGAAAGPTPTRAETPEAGPNRPAGQPPQGRGSGGRGGGGFQAPKPTEVYQFVVLCLDRATGKELWRQVAREEVPHEGHHRTDGTFASSSPVTDGERVYAYFGSRGVHCYDFEGKLQWSRDLGKMNIVMSFGEGCSPALAGETLIVNWDHQGDSCIYGLDKRTGKTLWKQARDEKTSWATPLVVEQDGKTQVVVCASGKIRSYDPATGKVIWECAGLTRNVIPSPVVGQGLLFATSGYQGNALLALRLDRTGDLTGSDAIVWSYRQNTPYVPSPLFYEGRLYFFANNNATLSCLEAKTGRVLFSGEKLAQLQGVYASPVAAAGRIYVVGRNGATAVLKASDKLEVLATNQLNEQTDASPVLVGKELFLRGRDYLYCVGE